MLVNDFQMAISLGNRAITRVWTSALKRTRDTAALKSSPTSAVSFLTSVRTAKYLTLPSEE